MAGWASWRRADGRSSDDGRDRQIIILSITLLRPWTEYSNSGRIEIWIGTKWTERRLDNLKDG